MIGCGLLAGAVLQGIGARASETADAGAVPLDEAPAGGAGGPAYALAAGK